MVEDILSVIIEKAVEKHRYIWHLYPDDTDRKREWEYTKNALVKEAMEYLKEEGGWT